MKSPILSVAAMALLFASCVTTRNYVFDKTDQEVQSREYVTAAKTLDGPDSKTFYGDRDQVLRNLDVGMLYHLANDPKASVGRFDEAERLIEENYTKSITNAATSFLLNDYALDYAGEPYEDLYLNVFKAIDYARQNQPDDAFVEINRMGTKLNLLEDKYRKVADSMNNSPDSKGAVKAGSTQFHDSALARFLSMVLYRYDHSYDNAAIDLQKIKDAFTSQPNLYAFPLPNLDGMVKPSDKVRFTVVGFSGQSPTKRANTLRLNTGTNSVVVSEQKEDSHGVMEWKGFGAIFVPGVKAGLNIKAQLPEMYLRPSKVHSITVLVDGVSVGHLELLERLDTIAVDTFELAKTPIFFKTVIRASVKGVLTQMAKEQANNGLSSLGFGGQLLGAVGGLAADVAVDATEQADLRSARYFPGQAWVGDFSIAPGTHVVSVEYFGRAGELLSTTVYPARNYDTKGLNLLSAYDLE